MFTMSLLGEITVQHLTDILRRSRPYFQGLPGYNSMTVGFNRAIFDIDEIYPNLFIGNAESAQNKQYLQHIGVTHILNSAEGNFPGMVSSNQEYYNGTGICYMGLPIRDLQSFNIHDYFEMAANFIHQSLENGGKVLVHCLRGRSRSSTIVVAYLMLKMNMTAQMALRMCCQRHTIAPNQGFLQRLVNLENSRRSHSD